ncbi:DUF6714 family protein [Neorhodopirellula lusitana]|uniref:DUF6714 family protein n=1 Tax=Neorhodopirellula lusitana TaxID=445327 RepID=UPI00384B411F
MNCRHCNTAWECEWEYCPECQRNFGGAIYPKQQTPEELAEIDQLIRLIRQAFDGNQLGDGTTIHEANLEGCYLNEEVRLEARAKDIETDWSDVPDWKIERFSSVLSFFDITGWVFYIPAYMTWTLRNWRTTDLIIADFVVWSLDPTMSGISLPRYEALSPMQAHAAYRFVKYFCDYSGDEESRRAMDAYWQRFASAAH